MCKSPTKPWQNSLIFSGITQCARIVVLVVAVMWNASCGSDPAANGTIRLDPPAGPLADAPPVSGNSVGTRVVLIDDFETACDPTRADLGLCVNTLGHPVRAFTADTARASNGSPGASSNRSSGQELVLSYSTDGSPNSWALYATHLRSAEVNEGLFFDASRFTDLVFEIRGARGGEDLEVKVADQYWFERESSISLGPLRRFLASGVSTRTRSVRIPLERVEFIARLTLQLCVDECVDQGDSCERRCEDDHPTLDLTKLALIALQPIGTGEIYVDNLRLERRASSPRWNIRQRAVDFIDRMRTGGSQREYDGDERHRDYKALARHWRVWAYTQGIALDNAARRGQAEAAYELAAVLVDNVARTSADNDESMSGSAFGWNFSWNNFEDTFRDIRVITGASSWALTGLGRYLASDLFDDVEAREPELATYYRRVYREVLANLLTLQRADGLFNAGWTVSDLANAAEYLDGGYTIENCRDADKFVECRARAVGSPEVCGSGLDLYHHLLLCYAYPEVYFDEDQQPSQHRIPFTVTEHNLDMLTTLQDAVRNAHRLGIESVQRADIVERLDRLRDGIFDLLYVPNDGRFATGAGSVRPDGRPWISPHTAIDNATWLAVHADLNPLTATQIDKLANGLAFTNEHFVKQFSGYQGDMRPYLGAHYFPDTFEDAFIEPSVRQTKGYHLEATTGLIQALAKFSNAFPTHERSATFARLADDLWFDLRLFAGRHGFAYSTDDLLNVSTSLESSTSAIWIVDTFDFLDRLERAQCYGKTSQTDSKWHWTSTGAYADIDISHCGYQLVPMVFSSIELSGGLRGSVVASPLDPHTIRVRVAAIPGATEPLLTLDGATIHWRALRYRGHHGTACGDRTRVEDWERAVSGEFYMDIDASTCGSSSSSVVAQLVPSASHIETTDGATTVVASLGDSMFRVSVQSPRIRDLADTAGWRLHWSAETPQALPQARGCMGKTRQGRTDWKATDRGISVEVDTRHCGFQALPSYVASVVTTAPRHPRKSNHWLSTTTAKGFRLELHSPGLTPAAANSVGLTVHWHAGVAHVPGASIATVAD